MENQNNAFIHDTINLDEIRALLGDEAPVEAPRTMSVEVPTEEPPQEKPTVEQESTPEPAPSPKAKKRRSSKEGDEPQGFAQSVYSMLHDLVYVVAAVTLFFVFFMRLVGVEGTSMLPTLHNRDFLLVLSNVLYGPEDQEPGDVVVINEPYHWDRDESLIVKRIIATEGQTVDIDFQSGIVSVDGQPLQEDYVKEPTYVNWEGDMGLSYPVTVPEDHIFVLGDNRNNSSDSRLAMVGMIDSRCVLGKAWFIVMPGQTIAAQGQVIDERQWSRIGLVR